ncbi:CinA family protein [Phenylobacterium sp.]|uniref:CinA family protein n=1 Tax=Phenylobacterium sp. TaxID=1871053 RepID=UPI003D2BA4E0
MAEALAPPLPDDIDRLCDAVLTLACDNDVRLAAAESCTGGLLASLLTDIPGKSHAFERGFVTYTDEAKVELLGIPRDLIRHAGVVSEACARAMAEGALTHSHADMAVSITGFTEGAPGRPAGLVHFACARRGGDDTRHRVERFGDVGRADVRLNALRVALTLLRDGLERPARA